ncbi:hypothetical protein HHK36_000615 [Tetracentron sinense]|uniref:Uncharacterized protein n=1 Tax=Tetracentron sinense TaxID=13715 RepID=A0A834ZUE3_TETSI|nr:hypothetical protein HHK36_000615 [Tetracentron sinense]
MAERGGDRGGFGRGFGGRGDRGDRGRGKEEQWVPVTKLGRLIKEGRIRSLEQIYLHSLPVKEHQIIETLLGWVIFPSMIACFFLQGWKNRTVAELQKLWVIFSVAIFFHLTLLNFQMIWTIRIVSDEIGRLKFFLFVGTVTSRDVSGRVVFLVSEPELATRADDNGEEGGDAASLISSSEWRETMQNLITTLSPSPTSTRGGYAIRGWELDIPQNVLQRLPLFSDLDIPQNVLQRSTITCKKFEVLCGDLFEISLIPLKEVLKHSGLKVDEVELIGVSSEKFAQFAMPGLTDASEKYSSRNLTSPIKANLHFFLSRSGILSLDRADVVIEVAEWVQDWLYTDGEDASATELTTRPAASEDACGYLGKLQQVLSDADKVKDWLEDKEAEHKKSLIEELCGDLWEKSLIPFKEVLKHSGLKVDEVELIGNATRVQSYSWGVSSEKFAQYVVFGLTDAGEKYSSRDITSPIKANLYLSLSKSGILSLDQVDEAAPGNNSEGNKDYLPVDDGISNASNSNVEKQSSMDPDTKETEEADI